MAGAMVSLGLEKRPNVTGGEGDHEVDGSSVLLSLEGQSGVLVFQKTYRNYWCYRCDGQGERSAVGGK